IACGCAAALLFQAEAGAQTRELATKGAMLDRVAAVVNDGVVLNSELDEQMAIVTERLRQQKLDLPPRNVLRQQLLARLVLTEIEVTPATEVGRKVPDDTLHPALTEVAQRNGIPLSQLPEALQQQGIEYAAYREDMRKELTLGLLRQRDVLQRISITPREIDQFISKQANTPSEANQYNVSHILITLGKTATPRQIDQPATPPADVPSRPTRAPRS